MMNDIRKIYIKFNKPYGVLSSFTDSENRPALCQYIPIPDVYSVGRLDMDSEGLMFLTNDGWLNHRITSPESHFPKTYLVQVEGLPTAEKLELLSSGLVIKGNHTTLPCTAKIIPDPQLPERSKPVTPHDETHWLEMRIVEGKKRQIRHMTAAVGLPTLRLIRIAIGPLELESLHPGMWEFIPPSIIKKMKDDL